jgi:hypothetical protein
MWAFKKRPKFKLMSIIFLILFFLVSYISYTLYNNIQNADMTNSKYNMVNCSNYLKEGYESVTNCLHDSLNYCNPATNFNGFNIFFVEKGECKSIIKVKSDTYSCSFPISYLEDFNKDKLYNDKELIEFVKKIPDNKYCNRITFFEMLIKDIYP